MTNLSINLRRAAIFTGIFILMLMVMEFNSRLEALNKLNGQRDIVRTQATQAMQTQLSRQTQVAFAGSDQAVEEWARSDGHYLQPGDHPVVPLGVPGGEPIEAGTPTPMPAPMPAWQVWWQLFFSE